MMTNYRMILRNDVDCPKCGEKHFDIDQWAIKPHKTHLCLKCKKMFEGSQKAVSRPTFVKIQQPNYIIYKPMKIIYNDDGTLTEDGKKLFTELNNQIYENIGKITGDYKMYKDSDNFNFKDAIQICENRLFEVKQNYQPLLPPALNSEAIQWGDTEF